MDSKKEHAKIQFHKHAASLSALPLLGFHLPGLGGRADGVHLPAFKACKLWALVVQEGACLLPKSDVWGRGRDSSSAGTKVDIFIHKENNKCICVPSWWSDGCTKGCSLGVLWSHLAIVNSMKKMKTWADTNRSALAICSPLNLETDPFTRPMSRLRRTRIPYVWWDRLRLVLL